MSPVIPDDPELSRATFRAMGYCGALNGDGRLWCTRSPGHDGKHAHRYEKTNPLDAVGVEWT
ncbi:hypothetical protein ACGFZR_24900 [Streptomyces sp. NPDC048241]|uniref:hypothetical protein n=1 Tax=Streptomyces sp. NPDC048241 TaxID=3365521 RepID=UPI00371C8435